MKKYLINSALMIVFLLSSPFIFANCPDVNTIIFSHEIGKWIAPDNWTEENPLDKYENTAAKYYGLQIYTGQPSRLDFVSIDDNGTTCEYSCYNGETLFLRKNGHCKFNKTLWNKTTTPDKKTIYTCSTDIPQQCPFTFDVN